MREKGAQLAQESDRQPPARCAFRQSLYDNPLRQNRIARHNADGPQAISEIEAQGILMEATGAQRNRVYIAREILDVLQAPMQS